VLVDGVVLLLVVVVVVVGVLVVVDVGVLVEVDVVVVVLAGVDADVVVLDTVALVAALIRQSRRASAASVLAPWLRLAWSVVLTDAGRLATEALKLLTALVAVAQSPACTAA
jgi:hypothetical protein